MAKNKIKNLGKNNGTLQFVVVGRVTRFATLRTWTAEANGPGGGSVGAR